MWITSWTGNPWKITYDRLISYIRNYLDSTKDQKESFVDRWFPLNIKSEIKFPNNHIKNEILEDLEKLSTDFDVYNPTYDNLIELLGEIKKSWEYRSRSCIYWLQILVSHFLWEDVISKVDWLYWDSTRQWIMKLQEYTKYDWWNGVPWPNTIEHLIEFMKLDY